MYFQHPYFQARRKRASSQRQRCRQLFERISANVDIATLRGQPMLDVGCDTGGLLGAARRDYDVVPFGIDVAEQSIDVARAQGLRVYCTSIEGAPSHLNGFRLITAIDLIEHLASPGEFLREAWRRLSPGGVLYVETPNIESQVYALGRTLHRFTKGRPREFFERLFPPQHIQYFTKASLAGLARDCGFDVLGLGARALPASDIAVSLAVQAALGVVQFFDRVKGTQLLIYCLLQRPARSPA